MPKYVRIAAHLSVNELENRYRKAADAIERSHFHIIWLLAQGKRVREVSEVTSYCANWIRILARRYNHDGPQGLQDLRHQNAGASPLLSKEQQVQLQGMLEGGPPDGGVWTGPKVAYWMEGCMPGGAPKSERATRQQWEQITDITFHDLRHDARPSAACLRLYSWREVAVSLEHVTKKGTPAVATTARYTQPNREQMKHKLKDILL